MLHCVALCCTVLQCVAVRVATNKVLKCQPTNLDLLVEAAQMDVCSEFLKSKLYNCLYSTFSDELALENF